MRQIPIGQSEMVGSGNLMELTDVLELSLKTNRSRDYVFFFSLFLPITTERPL